MGIVFGYVRGVGHDQVITAAAQLAEAAAQTEALLVDQYVLALSGEEREGELERIGAELIDDLQSRSDALRRYL